MKCVRTYSLILFCKLLRLSECDKKLFISSVVAHELACTIHWKEL